jgi:hypothetical protein
MKITTVILFISLSFLSCKTTHFDDHYGLVFKQIDWQTSLERPFIINSDVIPNLGDDRFRLYLPADLFENTTITSVYYDEMRSKNITVLNDEKDRVLVLFDKENHLLKTASYELNPDEAVVVIDVNNHRKTIKIEDIRVPFYVEP